MGYNLFTSHKPCLLFVTKGVCVYKLGYYAAVNTHSKLGVCITIVVENFLPYKETQIAMLNLNSLKLTDQTFGV